jgi:hypothetical protein
MRRAGLRASRHARRALTHPNLPHPADPAAGRWRPSRPPGLARRAGLGRARAGAPRGSGHGKASMNAQLASKRAWQHIPLGRSAMPAAAAVMYVLVSLIVSGGPLACALRQCRRPLPGEREHAQAGPASQKLPDLTYNSSPHTHPVTAVPGPDPGRGGARARAGRVRGAEPRGRQPAHAVPAAGGRGRAAARVAARWPAAAASRGGGARPRRGPRVPACR